MGKNSMKPVLRIRYRKPGKVFGTTFTLSRSRNGGKKNKGRILSVRKLSYEETWRIGEFLPFDPKALLREFNEAERTKGGAN